MTVGIVEVWVWPRNRLSHKPSRDMSRDTMQHHGLSFVLFLKTRSARCHKVLWAKALRDPGSDGDDSAKCWHASCFFIACSAWAQRSRPATDPILQSERSVSE